MEYDTQIRGSTVVRVFFVTDLVLGAAYVINFLAGAPSWTLTVLVDLNEEGSLPSWYSSMQWFCVAMLLGFFARRNFERSQPRSWLLLALPLLFLALSMDEIVQIHEVLGAKTDALLPAASRESSPFPRTGIWMFVIGGPFLVVFGVMMLCLRQYFRASPGAFGKIVSGMAIMLAGALGIEVLANFVGADPIYDLLQTTAEEMMEILGATVVLWGSVSCCADMRLRS